MNRLPIIGWTLSFIGNVSLAVPFWICWTACGLGEKFFGFMPQVYLRPSFWNCVGLFMIISVLRCLMPTFASVSQTNKEGK